MRSTLIFHQKNPALSTNFEQEKHIKQENEYEEELDYDYHDKERDWY